MEKYRYEIRQIDAWADGMDGGWTWNESWHICDMNSAAENIKRAFLRKLHSLGIYFTIPVRVDYDGSIWEVVRRDNDMPLFALIPCEF